MSRDFDATFPTRRSKVVQSAGIIEYSTINIYTIIMETFLHRSLRSSHPNAIRNFLQNSSSPCAALAQTYLNAIRMGRYNAKSRISLRVHLRVLLPRLI